MNVIRPSQVEVTNEYLLAYYQELFEQFPERASAIIENVVLEFGTSLEKDLQTEPGPVVYPIAWTSEAQRRMYFATNGFGEGIPTVRNHDLVRAYKVEVEPPQPGQIAAIVVSNDDPARDFTTGIYQQRYHAITGWFYEQDVFDVHRDLMTDQIADELAEEFGGA
jgi:hypothetical protein